MLKRSGERRAEGDLRPASHVPPTTDPGRADLTGTMIRDRFEVIRRLGAGGMGVVYETRDRKRDATVALKTLTRLDPNSIYRMKNEFRLLADVVHPNLVGLHELHAEGNLWFFTMDLVRGVSFIEHVRIDSAVAFEDTMAIPSDQTAPNVVALPPTPGSGAFREQALRHALLQLVRGVDAIHRAGKLHRDLKPTNVLVTRTGQVVILDFGLASDQHEHGVGRTVADGSVSGTPSYMAPEQCDGSTRLTPASDWYAVGVMLFEALTGSLPFSGRFHEVFHAKQHRDAPAPAAIADDIPDDLNAICVELLRRRPEDRLEPAVLLERLERSVYRGASKSPLSARARSLALPFAGRRAELNDLRAAFRATENGRPVVALVHGEPGMGKSTLVERFLAELEPGEAATLAGRCYERENVPFKLLDGVVDSLSRHLRTLSAVDASRLVPRHVHALTRLFPALARVDVVARAPARALPQDTVLLRRRAAAALAELLTRTTDERPLAVYIDDLHWGDVDGARILAEVLSSDDGPPALFVVTYRTREGETSECLQTLLESEAVRGACDLREIALGPLDAAEVAEMVGTNPRGEGMDPAAIHREAQGNPYLIAELMRFAADGAGDVERAPGLGPSNALLTRVSRLDADARLCLELLAVAGRPIPEELLSAAARIGDALPAALSALRSSHLARSSGDLGNVVYHDRIREVVGADIDTEALRARHRALAAALESTGSDDWEALAAHYEGAGDLAKAVKYTVRAAERTASALAYGRAIELFERALALQPEASSQRRIKRQLADALVAVGRGTEAAARYAECVPSATAEEAAELRILAAMQLLHAGHFDMAIAGVREAVEGVGIMWPEDFEESIEAFSAEARSLRARGLDFAPRDEGAVERDDLTRVDTWRGAAYGLWGVDALPARFNWFLLRALREALDVGEPFRIARAAYMEAAALSVLDPRAPGWLIRGTAREASDRLMEVADRATALVDDPHPSLWRQWALGCRSYYAGGATTRGVRAHRGGVGLVAHAGHRLCPDAASGLDSGQGGRGHRSRSRSARPRTRKEGLARMHRGA